jgi:PAS domain-containing protein
LRSLVPCVFTLPHPAAIFWGDKLAMIYNEAWETTSHSALKQGKPPNDAFDKDTLDTFRDYLHGHIPRPIVASELPGHHAASTEKPSVVCSPIHDDAKVAGVLVQIFSQTHSNNNQTKEKISGKGDNQKDSEEMNTNRSEQHDETALDRQPFFQKFAEMLPTGLAILNHKADPLFVNHQFHSLTAHRGPDQSFRMWPETIHPDDYERVMDEYHKAFDAQTELETEFRAFGEDQWRLFLMRPLGENNLQQFDLQRLGGYICALIDVSDMKNAEIAQTRVAKEARERKTQQERFIDMYEPRSIDMCRSNLLTLCRISHEIRNPLSAVIHCAENILDAVHGGEAKSDTIAVDEIVDAVHTIQLCVDHQVSLVENRLSSPTNPSCRKLLWTMCSAFRNSMPPCSRLLLGKFTRSEIQSHR